MNALYSAQKRRDCMVRQYVNVKPPAGMGHDRQWFNTLIPPSHKSAAVTVDCISRLIGPVRLALRYTMVDIHCRDKRYE